MMTYKEGLGRLQDHESDIPDDVGIIKSKKFFQYNTKLDKHRSYLTHTVNSAKYTERREYIQFGINHEAWDGIGNFDYKINRTVNAFSKTYHYNKLVDSNEPISLRDIFGI